MEWFRVDKEGLAKLLERKGKAFVLFELLQNSWDTDARKVEVALTPIPNKPFCEIRVSDDDPEGFKDLSHAFTLFAESEKKGDPTKRGRFNLGEKLVLALCQEAEIRTTKGTVKFSAEGRSSSHSKLEKGSEFRGIVRMTRAEYEEVCSAVATLIPPKNISTFFNGQLMEERTEKEAFVTTLATEVSDSDGFLRKTARKTLVTLFAVRENETPYLYEMGIPVVELSGGEPFHINVHQKIPLNSDRDNVTPSYLKALRAEVLNHAHMFIEDGDDATRVWVVEALGSEKASKEASQTFLTKAFGDRVVSVDVRDPQANKKAAAEGFTVIPGGALPKEAWATLKNHGLIQSAGKVFPTHPEEVAPTRFIPTEEWTEGQHSVARLTRRLARTLLNEDVTVVLIDSPLASVLAAWKDRKLTFNVGRLGTEWFTQRPTEAQISLILHEFGHHYESDHLSESYYRALTDLGAKLAMSLTQAPHLLREM